MNGFSNQKSTGTESIRPKTRLSGITIQYYYACKRELWFHLHYFEPPQDHTHLSLGRLIHETSFKSQGKQQMVIGNAVVDIIQIKNQQIIVSEIKKSSKLIEPTLKQLQYYLLLMKRQGITAQGVLRVPKERKTIKLALTPEIEYELEQVEKDIMEIADTPAPPPYERKPYCANCAYHEFCGA